MPGPVNYVVMTPEAAVVFDTGFTAEDGRRDESDDKANGQRLYKGVGHVD